MSNKPVGIGEGNLASSAKWLSVFGGAKWLSVSVWPNGFSLAKCFSVFVVTTWPVWPNGWVFVYELNDSGFESSFRGFFISDCCSQIWTRICVTFEDHCFINMELIEICITQRNSESLNNLFWPSAFIGAGSCQNGSTPHD